MIASLSAYRPNQDELAREQRLVNDERWQDERQWLNEFLPRLDRASTGDELFAAHVSLVARLRARQDHIVKLRERSTELASERSELARIRPKPVSELRAVQAELTDVEWEAAVHRALYWLSLDLGDALAWRSLRFDRAAISVLGMGNRVAWLSSGRGWDAEIAAINELSNMGTYALLNDATTCLRLGDITCFFEDRVEIREVKAGRIVPDEDPQQVRLHNAVTLINEHHGVVEGASSAIVRCAEPFETYLGQLPRIFERARSHGSYVEQISRSQLVLARDFANTAQKPFDGDDVRAVTGWPPSDIVMDWGTSLRRMRDRRHNFPYLAPLALLPLGLEDMTDLLLGQLDYSTWVNVSSVARILRGRGLVAEPFGPPESEHWFLLAGRQRGSTLSTVHIAPHLREQLAIELMTPTYVAKLATTLLDALEESPTLAEEQTLVTPGDEQPVWQAPYGS
jgi:hypothetical protein